MECNIEKNKKKCTCTYEPCSRKGKCCECITYHWNMGELPGCLFPSEVERTYDRSIEKFIETYKQNQYIVYRISYIVKKKIADSVQRKTKSVKPQLKI